MASREILSRKTSYHMKTQQCHCLTSLKLIWLSSIFTFWCSLMMPTFAWFQKKYKNSSGD